MGGGGGKSLAGVEREGECRKYPTGALSARQGWRVRHARNFHPETGREGEEENDCPYLLGEAKFFLFLQIFPLQNIRRLLGYALLVCFISAR